jgi:nucleotide-binding universal stress UspA family protein
MRREKTNRSPEQVTHSPIRALTRRGATPYRRILVPLDGTPFAEAALRPAAELAARAGAVVNLVGVVTETVGTLLPTDPVQSTGVGEAVDRVGQREGLLREACERVHEEWGCRTTYELLTGTSATDAILDAARRLEADLVVAATHMRGWLARTILGSTAEDLVEAGPFPVLLIPSDDARPAASTPMQGPVESIVIAVDPDASGDDRAVAHGALWAQLWNARLVLAQAVLSLPLAAPAVEVGGPIAPFLPFLPEHRDAAEAKLAGICDALRREGVDAHARVLDGEGAADALLRFVESIDADLLVVGRHAKGFWERLFEGSETTQLARGVRTTGLLVCHEEAR